MTLLEFAPAKINLTLHVTGQRADGYHLLDSLVCFAGVGDRLRLEPNRALTLAIDGPDGPELTAGPDNLVLRAAQSFGLSRGAALVLGIARGYADPADHAAVEPARLPVWLIAAWAPISPRPSFNTTMGLPAARANSPSASRRRASRRPSTASAMERTSGMASWKAASCCRRNCSSAA